ncbi:phosphatidylethanolamine N-methyltransferase family protein, partial [Candidatus Parcubacteria bacterium]|nr:phosphatidylethanolamine N-methyltransferase family protein [Candidatus Parcubacteria bacterium]
MNLFKSILHNIGVVAVGLVFAFIGVGLDTLLDIHRFRSPLALTLGILLILIGFLIRVWATYYFYKEKMRVIVLKPQNTLITGGPFRYTRNPLYLGGNVFVFFGASLLLGSPSALALALLQLALVDFMIRRLPS